MKRANTELVKNIAIISNLRNYDFIQFKEVTKSPSTFAGDRKLWKEHVGQFFVDDNIFDDHKKFIPGLFIHPAFQQLCKENINPVEDQTYDDDLHAITESLFDLDPFSCTNEGDFQKKMIKILNLHENRFEASSENFSTDKVKVRTEISISKNGRKICLIELKHLLLHVNSEPIYQVGAYYSNMLSQDDFIDKFTFPMLLLAIVGNQYFVYGGINYDKKIQVFFINSFSTNDRNSFHTLYQIIEFLANTKTDHLKWPEYEICDGKYKNYPDFVNKDVNIISENKQVFLCDGKLYKFSPSYCSGAQQAMGTKFAPEFMREFKINGEFMIEMEYLEGYEVLTKSLFKKLSETEQSNVLESLLDAIKTLHAQGYVHGDLRLPNIMVKKQNEIENGMDVKIVDFEFAGKSGAVYYPRLNRNIQWGIEDTKKESKKKKSYYSYKKITFENDKFMLKAVLVSLSNLDKFTDLAEKLGALTI